METHQEIYLRLRQLEVALGKPGAIENLRDTAGNALGFFGDLARAIDAYEDVYPALKAST